MVSIHSRCVTFTKPAGAVHLVGDFTDWDKKPIAIKEPLTLEFPPGAYLEYAFLDASGTPFADPDNPHQANNPWWSYPRAVELPGFKAAALPMPSKAAQVHRHRLESRAFGAARRYYVYEPSQPAQATLYVQDGVAYYRTARLAETAEALCEQNQIRPLRLVFLEPQDRRVEYWFNPRYEAFVLEEILPAVERQYGPTPERGLWGASLGGVVSAWLALRHPQVFSLVITQSACLTLEPGGSDSYTGPEWLTAQYMAAQRLPLRLYCETGQIEWLLAPNRRFVAMLADKGYAHAYFERPSGHNWMTWRQGLEPALRYMFGIAG
jgi:enterochelin esterase family protein